ncbi:MAG: hypothetical protein IT577_23895 [Verrucomicrobiae bacterium]|nr:hypothetical protein [Verrucomicrobiae bacterium]
MNQEVAMAYGYCGMMIGVGLCGLIGGGVFREPFPFVLGAASYAVGLLAIVGLNHGWIVFP